MKTLDKSSDLTIIELSTTIRLGAKMTYRIAFQNKPNSAVHSFSDRTMSLKEAQSWIRILLADGFMCSDIWVEKNGKRVEEQG